MVVAGGGGGGGLGEVVGCGWRWVRGGVLFGGCGFESNTVPMSIFFLLCLLHVWGGEAAGKEETKVFGVLDLRL